MAIAGIDANLVETKLTAKVRAIGNSLGIILPKRIISQSGIKKGDEITVEINSQKLQNAKRIQRILSAKGSMKRRYGDNVSWDYDTEDFEESDKQEHK